MKKEYTIEELKKKYNYFIAKEHVYSKDPDDERMIKHEMIVKLIKELKKDGLLYFNTQPCPTSTGKDITAVLRLPRI